MTNPLKWSLRGAAVALAVLFPAVALRGGEVDKYLPEDSEIVINLNVKQLFQTPLMQKIGIATIKETLKANAELDKWLKDFAFDPLALERVIIATAGAGDDQAGVFILYGNFDKKKMEAKAAELIEDESEFIAEKKAKRDNGVEHKFYEVEVPGQEIVYVALLDQGPLLVAPTRVYLLEALDKAAGLAKPGLKDKELHARLIKLDSDQTLTVAGNGGAVAQSLPAEINPIRSLFDKMAAISGSLTLTADLKMELVCAAKTEDDATKVKAEIDKTIAAVEKELAGAVADQKELVPLHEIVKSLTVKLEDKLLITVKGSVKANILEQLFNR